MKKKPTRRSAAKAAAESSTNIIFENNALLPVLFGQQDENLFRIEKMLGVVIVSRGNIVSLEGEPGSVAAAKAALNGLYAQLERGADIEPGAVDAAIRLALPGQEVHTPAGPKRRGIQSNLAVKTLKKTIQPYSHAQETYIDALLNNDLVFAVGPAGTGKTYIAVAVAVMMFLNRKVERIILSRPAVEAGEKLGFLPGDLKEKIDPYLRPLYDALYDMLPGEKVVFHIENGEIEVAPLAFMRGRTLANSYVILDEAQNTTPTQMKMFLTRLGENSRMVVTGDLTQTDLPRDITSGLRDAVRKLENVEGIATVRFSEQDVVRHALAARIVQAYDEWDRKKKGAAPHDV